LKPVPFVVQQPLSILNIVTLKSMKNAEIFPEEEVVEGREEKGTSKVE
jgi:hypothetical protein